MKAKLLILDVLHRSDRHSYEIRRMLQASMVPCYLDVDVGTLYYAVRRLKKDGAIEAVAQERVTRGGMRTIYRITSAGRAEFQDGFFRQIEEDGQVSQTLYGALLFLRCVERERLTKAIRCRIGRTDALIAELDPLRAEMPALSTGPDFLFRHIERQRCIDRDWLEDLAAALEADLS